MITNLLRRSSWASLLFSSAIEQRSSRLSCLRAKRTAVRAARAHPETASQAEARAILMKMAQFLGGTQNFRVGVRSGYDAEQPSGQKIEFGEYRTVTLSRPDRMRVETERSDGAKNTSCPDWKRDRSGRSRQQSLCDCAATRCAGPRASSISSRISALRLPLAALLLNRLPEELQNQGRFGGLCREDEYLRNCVPSSGRAYRHGGFSGVGSRWRQALPQRIVLTYKKAVGQPQFWADFIDWNLAPQLNDATFSAQVPEGLQKVAFAALTSACVAHGSPVVGEEGSQIDENRIVGPCHCGVVRRSAHVGADQPGRCTRRARWVAPVAVAAKVAFRVAGQRRLGPLFRQLDRCAGGSRSRGGQQATAQQRQTSRRATATSTSSANQSARQSSASSMQATSSQNRANRQQSATPEPVPAPGCVEPEPGCTSIHR